MGCRSPTTQKVRYPSSPPTVDHIVVAFTSIFCTAATSPLSPAALVTAHSEWSRPSCAGLDAVGTMIKFSCDERIDEEVSGLDAENCGRFRNGGGSV